MKKIILPLLAAAFAVVGMAGAQAQDKLTLQIKWVTQGQFAGYYVAKSKGFYAEENLDVTIIPAGPTTSVPQVMAGGGADVGVEWAASALVAREKGVKMVNIAQPFNKSGLMMICPKETGVMSEADFKGKTLGVWFYGNEYPFFAWMNKLGLSTDGGPDGVTVLQQSFDIQPMIQKQADCISVMTYNEYGQALDAGYTPDSLTIFNYTELGNDLLEDGLYVLEERLADPAFADQMVRFVRASMKGWDYALANPGEAAQIIVDSDDSGAATLEHQTYMSGEVAKLMGDANGKLDTAVWDRTVKALLDQKILTKEPDATAYTTAITDKL
jgi:NitT/TauT family transport system substrate-binding protein